MTDFETHPAGTADLVKRLRSYQEFEQNRYGQIVCVESEIANEAADHIEQLVATVEQLEATLTRANASTAAAYEVAAMEAELWDGNILAYKIRALATLDQTAALDKLIAEAEARGKTIGIATEKIRRLIEWLGEDDCNVFLLPHDDVVKMRAILAASKKGGV